MPKSVSVNTELLSKLVIALFVTMHFAIQSNGQEVWTTDQFLNFNPTERGLPYQENLNFIDRAKGMPFINSYELRTETDEMQLEQQQFQLRFQFNSRDERKAFDEIMIANKSKYEWMQSNYELDMWEEKYDNIIDLYFLQKELDLIIQDLALLSDKKVVLKRILDSEERIDVSDWIANESEIFNVLSDSLELELQKNAIAQKVFGSERQLPRLEDSNIISIDEIKVAIAEVIKESGLHPDEGLAMAEQEIANAEYNLEIAEANKWLEFAQIQYQINAYPFQ